MALDLYAGNGSEAKKPGPGGPSVSAQEPSSQNGFPAFDLSSSVHPSGVTADAQGRAFRPARSAEALLQQSEERFRTLFELGPVAVSFCDASGVIENFNQRAVELWGRAPHSGDGVEKFCGSYKMYRTDGALLPHECCPVAEVLRNEISELRNQEVVIERPDGSRITVVVNIRQLKNEEGQLTGAVNCFYDVTERKVAELASARLAAIVECSDDAIIAKNLDGVIQSWNHGAERLFGYTAEQAIGQPVLMLIPPDLAGEEAVILSRIRRGEHVDHYESIRRHKDGRLLNVSLTISPIVNARGEIVGASKIARDITERKLADAALLKSEKLVAAGRLAASMAHEINNPLQAVINLVSLLASSPGLTSNEKSLAKTAEEELCRIGHLTRQSLSFYRESATPGLVNLAETIEGVLEIFSYRLRKREIVLKRRFASNVPVIQSIAGEIRQVATALLLNAVDAVPRGGTISVHLHKSFRCGDGSVAGGMLSIADNGVGISALNATHIFDPFFTTKGELGTGLGLWVANGIVSRLGGSIQMRSTTRPGRSGSCFSIFFPNQIPAQPPQRELAEAMTR